MRPPPRWVRRILLAPAVIVLGVLLLVSAPLWLLVALAVTSRVPGRLRIPRILWLVTVYLLWDGVILVVLFVLWVASGFGWRIHTPAFEQAHYRVLARGLQALFRVFGSVLRLEIVLIGSDPASDSASDTGSDPDPEAARADFGAAFAGSTPLLVASRHAGPGDSFILIHTLVNEVARRPRIVLKDTLQWDPAIDVMLSRIPARFISPTGFGPKAAGGADVGSAIRDLATGMGPQDAFVIFPEGGNVTSARRRSRIERLERSGRTELAERAEAMSHVMAPQPGGVYAALDAAPDADVVLIGHTDLDRLVTIGDIWRELPMDKRITMRAWRVPRAEVPADRDAQAEWLFTWFERIDRWIDEHRSADASPAPSAERDN